MTNSNLAPKLDFGLRPMKSVAEIQKATEILEDMLNKSKQDPQNTKLYGADGKEKILGTSHGIPRQQIEDAIKGCYMSLIGMVNITTEMYAPSSTVSSGAKSADNQLKQPAKVANNKTEEKNNIIKLPAAQEAENKKEAKNKAELNDKYRLRSLAMGKTYTMDSLANLVYNVAKEGTEKHAHDVKRVVKMLLRSGNVEKVTDRPKQYTIEEAEKWFESHYNKAVEALREDIDLNQNKAQNDQVTDKPASGTKKEQEPQNEAKKGQKEDSTAYVPSEAREKEAKAFAKKLAEHLKENDGHITKKAFHVELIPGGSSVSAFLKNNAMESKETDNQFIEDIASSIGLKYKGVLDTVTEKPEEKTQEVAEEKTEETKSGWNFESVFNKMLKFIKGGERSKAAQTLRQEMSKYPEFKNSKGKLDKQKAKVLTQQAFERYDKIEKAKKEGKTADFVEKQEEATSNESALSEIKEMSAEDFTTHLIDTISAGNTKDALEDAKIYFEPQGWTEEEILAELKKYGYPGKEQKKEEVEIKKTKDEEDNSWLTWDEKKFAGYFYEATKVNSLTPKALEKVESEATEYLKTNNSDISNDDIDKWIDSHKYKGKARKVEDKAVVDAETDVKAEETTTEEESTPDVVNIDLENLPAEWCGLQNVALSKSQFKKLIKKFLRDTKNLPVAYELGRDWYNKHYSDKSDKAYYQWINNYAEASGVDTKQFKKS